MRFTDYLKLGFVGIQTHKKRAFMVISIVGLLFGVIIGGAFVLQGFENATLGRMLQPTNGKVLVMSSVDDRICEDKCDAEAETRQLKQKIRAYGGKIIKAEVVQKAVGFFYKLDQNIIPIDNRATDAVEIVAPLITVANIIGIELPEQDAEIADRIKALEEVRAKAWQQIVSGKDGEKYYIADILPSGVYACDLSLRNIGQGNNPLDLILNQVKTGTSQNFIAEISEGATGEQLPESATSEEASSERADIVFAEFDNIETAFEYYKDEANYCSELDRVFGTCSSAYRYQITTAIVSPLTTYENLQSVWLVFKVAAIVLGIIAIIIALSTYTRLIGQDIKIISLYRLTGATKKQIRLVYMIYLIMLSSVTILFSIVIGLILAGVLSLANMTALKQAFALGLGVVGENIWLVGWSNFIWYSVGAMLIAAVMAVVLGNSNFKDKELARRIK